MMKKIFCLLPSLILCINFLFSPNTGMAQAKLSINSLSCDYRDNPLGIENLSPRLSWKLLSPIQGEFQTAYQLLVASSPDKLNIEQADLWNSGKVTSNQSVHVKYAGQALQPRQRCYWKLRVWDENDLASDWSNTAYWEMGLLSESQWLASWIRHPDFLDTLQEAKPAPYFRKDFVLGQAIQYARAYITGLGYFELEINGQKIGDDILSPVKTDYDKTVSYVIHDISDVLKEGRNTVGIILGTGWYNHFAQSAWGFDQAPWRSYPEVRCQLEITFQDGSQEIIGTDQSWDCSQGPIRFDGIRNGEHYDARLEMPGWSLPVYVSDDWLQAVEVQGPRGKPRAQQLPPIKRMQEIKPVAVDEVKPGVYVFDLGQNIAGFSRIRVAGPKGTKITLKHGEKLNPDSTVDQSQILRFLKTGEAQTDQYILKGKGVEVWEPRFVYHGFQYVEVSGLTVAPTLETLTGIVLHTAFQKTGHFESSNPLLNRIQKLMEYSFIGNYHGLPTDCPHREKVGWTGDGHLVAETGLLNYQIVSSYIKWMDDFVDAQLPNGLIPAIVPSSGWGYKEKSEKSAQNPGPQWRGAIAIIPWQLYRYTGDTSLLMRYYQPVKNYVNYLHSMADQHLLQHGIDDHKAIGTKTENHILASAYYYHITDLTARMAEVLAFHQDQQEMSDRAKLIKQAYQDKYLNKEQLTFGNGGQTSLSMSLSLGLVPKEYEAKVRSKLETVIAENEHFFDVGVVGIKCLFDALGDQQQSESIYQMVNQREFPSYGWWIDKGANTLWQDWDGGMSHNHIMFGSVSEWFYQSLAGINPDDNETGFKHINFKPEFIEGLSWVSAEYESLYGTIVSSWERNDNGDQVLLKVSIPVNSTASVVLPNNYQFINAKDGQKGKIELLSGDYSMEIGLISEESTKDSN